MRTITLLSVLFILGTAHAQPLSPEAAVEKALKSHPDIRTAETLQRMAYRQNTAAAAGMMPSVVMNGGWNGNNQNTSLTFNNGSEVSRQGAGSSALTGGLQISQTIFDGMGMFATRKRLGSQALSADFGVSRVRRQVRENVLNSCHGP